MEPSDISPKHAPKTPLATTAHLLGHLAVPVLGGSLGALFTGPAIKSGWYASLDRPPFNPPSYLFAPVWTTIYALMGLSSFLVASKGGLRAQAFPLSVYGVNLVFNFVWTPLFFKAHRIDLAMADIAVLWASIIALITVYRPIDPRASLCLVPYLLWVSFASCLTFSYWTRNTAIHAGTLVVILLLSLGYHAACLAGAWRVRVTMSGEGGSESERAPLAVAPSADLEDVHPQQQGEKEDDGNKTNSENGDAARALAPACRWFAQGLQKPAWTPPVSYIALACISAAFLNANGAYVAATASAGSTAARGVGLVFYVVSVLASGLVPVLLLSVRRTALHAHAALTAAVSLGLAALAFLQADGGATVCLAPGLVWAVVVAVWARRVSFPGSDESVAGLVANLRRSGARCSVHVPGSQ